MFQWVRNSEGRLIKVNFPQEPGLNLNTDQMGEGEQYSEYSVERNHGAYMSMRDYKHLPWQNQQPVERNPPWMSASFCSVRPANAPYDGTYNPSWGNHTNSSWEPRPPQYAPPTSPYYASTPQPPQPPQLSSLVEQAMLNLSKLVDTFIEEQRVVNVQANQKIDTVESSLDKRIDGLQREIDQKFDTLQKSISRLPNQLKVHQEEESPEEEWLSDTMVEEQCLQQLQDELIENFESSDIGSDVCPWEKKEETSPMLTGEGSGKEEMEEPQKPTA